MQNKRTFWFCLPLNMVKELGIAGEHTAAGGASDQPLLCMTAQMFPQPILDFKESITAYKKSQNVSHRQMYYKHRRKCSWFVESAYLTSCRRGPVVDQEVAGAQCSAHACQRDGRTIPDY